MTGGGVDLDGPDLSGGLGKLGRAVATQDATEHRAAELAAQAVRRHVPRRSGRLAAAVNVTGPTVSTGGVAYAGPINFGVGPRVGQRGPHNITPASFIARGIHDATGPITEAFHTQLEQDAQRVRNG